MNPIEYIKLRARAEEQAERLLAIIKEVESTLTKTDPDYPWVNLSEVRQTRGDLDEILEDVTQRMHLPRRNLQPLQMEFVMAFLDKYLPDVHYRVDAGLDLYATTFEVREIESKKTLDVAFKGEHLEVVVDNPFIDEELVFDLRKPISIAKLKESVFLLPTHHITDDATGESLSFTTTCIGWRPCWFTTLQVVDGKTGERRTQAASVEWSVNIPDHLVEYVEGTVRVASVNVATSEAIVTSRTATKIVTQFVTRGSSTVIVLECDEKVLAHARVQYAKHTKHQSIEED